MRSRSVVVAASEEPLAAHGTAGIWYNADVIMRVYLDNCCYNRPFDPQTDLRVCLETMAKMRVQALMKDGSLEYAWSDALDYELGQSPNYQDPDMIAPWRDGAIVDVETDDDLIDRAEAIQAYGIKAMDALHIASAESAGCDWFLTTDRGILKKLRMLGEMRIANPIDFITEDEE